MPGLLLSAALSFANPAHAGQRAAPVAPSCRSELAELRSDVEGNADRCVTEARPGCQRDEQLQVDAKEQADRCLPKGGAPEAARAPHCRSGLSLVERAGADVCWRTDEPKCPSGFRLRVRDGEDLCRA